MINKKILITSLLFLLGLILIAGFAFYEYFPGENPKTDESINQKTNTDEISVSIEKEMPASLESTTNSNVEVEVSNGDRGGLTVCSDRCGDGACQKEFKCKEGNLNCICQETIEECPQDCK